MYYFINLDILVDCVIAPENLICIDLCGLNM